MGLLDWIRILYTGNVSVDSTVKEAKDVQISKPKLKATKTSSKNKSVNMTIRSNKAQTEMVETEISGQKSTEKPIINNTEELKPEKNNSKAKDIKKIQHNFSKLSERIKKHKFQHSELLLELRPTVKDTNGFVIISQVESDTVNIKIRASKIDSKKAGEVLLCIFPCELYKFSKSFIHKELKDFKFSKTTDGKLKIGDSQWFRCPWSDFEPKITTLWRFSEKVSKIYINARELLEQRGLNFCKDYILRGKTKYDCKGYIYGYYKHGAKGVYKIGLSKSYPDRRIRSQEKRNHTTYITKDSFEAEFHVMVEHSIHLELKDNRIYMHLWHKKIQNDGYTEWFEGDWTVFEGLIKKIIKTINDIYA